MDNEIIEQLFLSMQNATRDKGSSVFSEYSKGISVPVTRENFHKIPSLDTERKLCFIDGGNLEIFAAPNLSVQLIRMYHTIYHKNRRISSERDEFFLLIKAAVRNGRLHYETESFGKSPVGKLAFYAYDQELRTGVSRLQINAIGNIVRRLCEIRTAEECLDKLSEGDFVVLDGDLQEKIQIEHSFFERVYKISQEKKINIAALAKTNTLLTESGNAFSILLSESCSEKEWIYYPIIKEDSEKYCIRRCMVKLNEKSQHAFKLEICSFLEDIKALASLLKDNSVDSIFLGYPYGLIEADKFARVTNEELEYLKAKLIAASERGFKGISRYFSLMDAHEILDNVG